MKEYFAPKINIRHDLIAFIDFVSEYGLKRAHRDNSITKSDLKRLTKLLDIPKELKTNESEVEGDIWVEWISFLALSMDLVSYDTKGIYAGYTSQEPSFPDNYVKLAKIKYEAYLSLSPFEKEWAILNALLNISTKEFYKPSLFGSQNRFSTWGSGVNAASKMNLPLIRKQLLEILASFETDTSIPFSGFVQHVKTKFPNLILSKHAGLKSKYDCFKESNYSKPRKLKGETSWIPSSEYNEKEMSESDPDAFEKVEGRYLAFFIEEIPVLMEFVTLEYDEEYINGLHTTLPMLPHFIKSFTITKKCTAMLKKDLSYINHIKTTATPDFKIFIEASLYPDKQLFQLEPYTEVLVRDRYTTTLELSRKKTVQSLATFPSLPSPIDVLTKMGVNIPKNVATDMLEWTTQADKLLVYEDVGVLEVDPGSPDLRQSILKDYHKYIVDEQNPNFLLVRDEKTLFSLLENKNLIPAKIHHSKTSVCAHKINCASTQKKKPHDKAVKLAPKQLNKVFLKESSFIALKSENVNFLKRLTRAFQEIGVSTVISDEKTGLCFIPNEARSKIKTTINKLSDEFQIEMV